jgi:hypothetical protein
MQMKILGYLLPLLVLLGCTAGRDPMANLVGSYRDYITIKGHITDHRYFSPLTNFVCAVPPLVEPGAVIRDELNAESGGVQFLDDMGTLKRVDYFLVPNSEMTATENDQGRRDIEGRIFLWEVNRLYVPSCPGTSVRNKEFISFPDGMKQDSALFGVALLPRGSSIAEAHKGRYDAVRGSLVVVRGNYVYMLTAQVIPNLFAGMSKELTNEEQDQRLLTDLKKWCGTFSFN